MLLKLVPPGMARSTSPGFPARGGVLLAILAVIALAITLGCRGSDPRPNSAGPRISEGVQYDDIPVPLRFELDDESWAYRRYESAQGLPFRSAELVYWGDRPLRELANWYEIQMPKHGWSHDETFEDREIKMVFVKGVEKAEVSLERMINRRGDGQTSKITCRILAR